MEVGGPQGGEVTCLVGGGEGNPPVHIISLVN